ncbi:MAG: DNA-binding protein [Desulfuromonas sp.]|nr:MAG: DNA-binding protein [Desulfuromonas sp.]
MKKTLLFLALALILTIAAGCTKDEPAQTANEPATATEAPQQTAAPASEDSGLAGKVVETMDAAGYTYVLIDSGSKQVWAAGPATAVAVGDEVMAAEGGVPMVNYHSKTLNRDFDLVYFVSSILNASAPKTLSGAPSQPAMPEAQPAAEVDLSGIDSVEGGQTVSDVFSKKAELSGKEIILRGKVVKFSPQIMGKNWLHVQDGSGDTATGSNDLTVTTAATVQVGDTVLITGMVTLDKDFGYGYKYDVIVEDAEVIVE